MNVFRVVLHAMLMLSAWIQWVDLTASANLATEEMGTSAVKVRLNVDIIIKITSQIMYVQVIYMLLLKYCYYLSTIFNYDDVLFIILYSI